MFINIITNTENTWGLSKDTKILQQALRAHQITVSHWAKTHYNRKHHLNIHLEILGAKHIRNAACGNAIIPNPEWFVPKWLDRVKRRNFKVWTKTNAGTQVFKGLGLPAQQIGFTSIDRWRGLAFEQRKYAFLHLAGNSVLKNTVPIARTWAKHPEWPLLHIYVSNPGLIEKVKPFVGDNIKLTPKHVSEAEIIQAQNEYLFSLQPSAAEGYGHCIVEPLSAGAIVISTDAPPMNEFPIIKCAAQQIGKQHYGAVYSLTDITPTIETVLALAESDLKKLHANNRKWWRTNHANFTKTIKEMVNQIPT